MFVFYFFSKCSWNLVKQLSEYELLFLFHLEGSAELLRSVTQWN